MGGVMRKLIPVVALALVVASGVIVFMLRDQQSPQRTLKPAEGMPAEAPAAPGDDGRSVRAEALPPKGSAGGLAVPEGNLSAKKPGRRLGPKAQALAVDRRTRAVMLASILDKITRAGEEAPSTESEQSEKPGELPKEYIQQQVREIVPLVKECYEMSLEQQSDLAGSLKVQFVIVGDEEYGGLIEESKILEGSTLANSAGLAECVRETMYAIKLKAPKGGGRVVVNYPFIFNSE